jgi:hypothetical protein
VASRRGIAERHQRSFVGRRNHALRQHRYRERQREKVTHQGGSAKAEPAMVSALPATAAIEARPPGTEVPAHDPPLVRSRGGTISCAFCGRLGRFLRHETLARAGLPEHQRRFRRRVEGS